MSIVLAAALAIQTFAGLSLDRAESDALRRSPDVAVAVSKVAESRALFDATRASYGPALMGNYALAPQGGNNGATIAQRLTTFGGQITLGDILAYSPLVAQANEALHAAQFDLANARRTERVHVINLYFAALSARATLQARRAALAGATADVRAARLRFRAGDAPRLDVVRADVAVSQADAALAQAQASAANTAAALATEIGVPRQSLHTVPAPFPTKDENPRSPAAAVANALAQRPEIASARENVAMREHALAAARRGGFPLVSVSGGYTTGIDSGVNVRGPSVTVNAAFPLGGAAHDRVLAEEARLVQARAQVVKIRRQIATEVAAAVRRFNAQTAARAAAARALSQAHAELLATQIGYRNGASSSLDVTMARATYVQALVSQISALYAQVQARATLQLLLGDHHAK